MVKSPSPEAPQSNLLYKLAFFCALLPLLPSQAPHLAGGTISAGIWELLRLLLVGIAIPYGIFSRRNLDSSEFGNELVPPKADAARSFVSHVLHDVPPVFDPDDESEVDCGGSKESAALPSPIPWRSRSGKVMEEEEPKPNPARSHSLPAAAFDAGDLLRRTSSFPPHRKLSSSPSLSSVPPPPSLPATMDGATKPAKRLLEEEEEVVDEPNSNCTQQEEGAEEEAVVEESAKEAEDEEVRGVEEEEGENEVDKKADEFIARFREEIRRQRIESIKSSTRQRSSSN